MNDIEKREKPHESHTMVNTDTYTHVQCHASVCKLGQNVSLS